MRWFADRVTGRLGGAPVRQDAMFEYFLSTIAVRARQARLTLLADDPNFGILSEVEEGLARLGAVPRRRKSRRTSAGPRPASWSASSP